MNPTHLYRLSDDQKLRYAVQPDNIPYFHAMVMDSYELPQSVTNTSLRFWLNNLTKSFDTHWHTYVELLVPIEGTYDIVINNIEYTLQEGDIMIIPSGVLHSIQTDTSGYRFIFLFEMDPFMGFQNQQQLRALLTYPIHITYKTHPDFYPKAMGLINRAAEEYWSRDRSYKELSIYSLLMELFAEYGNYRNSRVNQVPVPDSTSHDLAMRLDLVYHYVDQHLSDKIQLEDAAKVANYSLYHFSRIFKESTGQTFSDYLRQARIKAAQQLLQQADTQIIQIAHECGFASLSTFNRTFRSVTGSTPSEYRSLNAKKLSQL